MMRLVFAAAVVGVICCVPSAQAYGPGPWCAVTSAGEQGGVIWNCSFPSIEACRPEIIAGNRGSCIPNPAWPTNPAWQPTAEPVAPARAHHVRHKRHHRHHYSQ